MADGLTVTISLEALKRFQEVAELNEKQRRLLMGMLADQCGRGGGDEVSRIFEVGRNTVSAGTAEFTGKRETDSSAGRIRRPGAGRKSVETQQPGIVEAVKTVLENNSYGNPEQVLFWTTLSLRGIEKILVEQGFKINRMTVARIIASLGYSRQQHQKMLQAGKPHPDRDAQFLFINKTVEEFLRAGDPVISVDCKKKELLGNFKNNGSEYRIKGEARSCLDHDLELKELGKGAPYGVYVLNDNTGFVNLTKCSDTSEFAVESIRAWWQHIGSINFPGAKRLLINCDGGGSNGCRVRLWKEQLAILAEETGLEITVCHFPPGTSKWNKIEHRMFCYITRNWAGKPLIDIQTVVNFISNTTTSTGLKVDCRVDERQYTKGIKVSDERMKSVNMTPLGEFGNWNYTIYGFKN